MTVFREPRQAWWQRTDVRVLAVFGLVAVALVAVFLIVSALLCAGLPPR